MSADEWDDADSGWVEVDLSALDTITAEDFMDKPEPEPSPASTRPPTPLQDLWETMAPAERKALSQGHRDALWAEARRVDAWNATQYGDGRAADSSATEAEPEAGAAPFQVLTRSDLRAMPRIAWLIDGLVQTSGLVVLAGDGGIGKSAIAIDWSASIAAGRADWHGRSVLAGAVLYVAGEGVEGLEARLSAWEQHTGATIPDDAMHYVPEGFSLSDAKAVEHMRVLVQQHDYALVVLDTLSQLSAIENENDNAEVARVLAQAKAIRQARPGTSVLIVHHVSKGGRVRGASSIRNNADAVIVARADPGANVSTFALSTEHEHDGKQKNAPAETLDGFWLDEVGSGVVVKRGGADDLARAIEGVLVDGQDHAGLEFYLACAASDDSTKKAVRRRLDHMVQVGTVAVSGTRAATRWRLAP